MIKIILLKIIYKATKRFILGILPQTSFLNESNKVFAIFAVLKELKLA